MRRVAAGLLAAGLRPGERLVIAMPNSGDYLLLFFGAIAAGIVPLPASSLLTPAEVGFLIADAEPAAVAVAGGPGIPAGIDVRTLTESDIATIRAAAAASPAMPTPRRTTRRSSSTPPAPAAGQRACSTRNGTSGAVARPMPAGPASAPPT